MDFLLFFEGLWLQQLITKICILIVGFIVWKIASNIYESYAVSSLPLEFLFYLHFKPILIYIQGA